MMKAATESYRNPEFFAHFEIWNFDSKSMLKPESSVTQSKVCVVFTMHLASQILPQVSSTSVLAASCPTVYSPNGKANTQSSIKP